jgi:hypothetical protein
MKTLYSFKSTILSFVFFSILTFQFLNVSSQICPCTSADPNWSHQKAFLIDNSTNSSAIVNYQVLIELNTTTLIGAGDMNASGSDIRVSGSCDNSDPLDFWFDDINTNNTKIWVKVPNIAANGTEIIYVHYGNLGAVSAANGYDVFPYFDDFESSLSGWNFQSATWSNATHLGENTLSCTNLIQGSGSAAILNTSLGMTNYIVEAEFSVDQDGAMGGPIFEHDDFLNFNGYHLMTGPDQTMINTISAGSPDYSQSQPFVSDVNQWYDWKIVRNGSDGNIDTYLDNILQNSNPTVFSDGVGLWAYGDGNKTVYFDNVFVRHFSEIEPVVNELTISDIIAPVADVATLADVTAECEVASITAPTATDNCAGVITGLPTGSEIIIINEDFRKL